MNQSRQCGDPYVLETIIDKYRKRNKALEQRESAIIRILANIGLDREKSSTSEIEDKIKTAISDSKKFDNSIDQRSGSNWALLRRKSFEEGVAERSTYYPRKSGRADRYKPLPLENAYEPSLSTFTFNERGGLGLEDKDFASWRTFPQDVDTRSEKEPDRVLENRLDDEYGPVFFADSTKDYVREMSPDRVVGRDPLRSDPDVERILLMSDADAKRSPYEPHEPLSEFVRNMVSPSIQDMIESYERRHTPFFDDDVYDKRSETRAALFEEEGERSAPSLQGRSFHAMSRGSDATLPSSCRRFSDSLQDNVRSLKSPRTKTDRKNNHLDCYDGSMKTSRSQHNSPLSEREQVVHSQLPPISNCLYDSDAEPYEFDENYSNNYLQFLIRECLPKSLLRSEYSNSYDWSSENKQDIFNKVEEVQLIKKIVCEELDYRELINRPFKIHRDDRRFLLRNIMYADAVKLGLSKGLPICGVMALFAETGSTENIKQLTLQTIRQANEILGESHPDPALPEAVVSAAKESAERLAEVDQRTAVLNASKLGKILLDVISREPILDPRENLLKCVDELTAADRADVEFEEDSLASELCRLRKIVWSIEEYSELKSRREPTKSASSRRQMFFDPDGERDGDAGTVAKVGARDAAAEERARFTRAIERMRERVRYLEHEAIPCALDKKKKETEGVCVAGARTPESRLEDNETQTPAIKEADDVIKKEHEQLKTEVERLKTIVDAMERRLVEKGSESEAEQSNTSETKVPVKSNVSVSESKDKSSGVSRGGTTAKTHGTAHRSEKVSAKNNVNGSESKDKSSGDTAKTHGTAHRSEKVSAKNSVNGTESKDKSSGGTALVRTHCAVHGSEKVTVKNNASVHDSKDKSSGSTALVRTHCTAHCTEKVSVKSNASASTQVRTTHCRNIHKKVFYFVANKVVDAPDGAAHCVKIPPEQEPVATTAHKEQQTEGGASASLDLAVIPETSDMFVSALSLTSTATDCSLVVEDTDSTDGNAIGKTDSDKATSKRCATSVAHDMWENMVNALIPSIAEKRRLRATTEAALPVDGREETESEAARDEQSDQKSDGPSYKVIHECGSGYEIRGSPDEDDRAFALVPAVKDRKQEIQDLSKDLALAVKMPETTAQCLKEAFKESYVATCEKAINEALKDIINSYPHDGSFDGKPSMKDSFDGKPSKKDSLDGKPSKKDSFDGKPSKKDSFDGKASSKAKKVSRKRSAIAIDDTTLSDCSSQYTKDDIVIVGTTSDGGNVTDDQSFPAPVRPSSSRRKKRALEAMKREEIVNVSYEPSDITLVNTDFVKEKESTTTMMEQNCAHVLRRPATSVSSAVAKSKLQVPRGISSHKSECRYIPQTKTGKVPWTSPGRGIGKSGTINGLSSFKKKNITPATVGKATKTPVRPLTRCGNNGNKMPVCDKDFKESSFGRKNVKAGSPTHGNREEKNKNGLSEIQNSSEVSVLFDGADRMDAKESSHIDATGFFDIVEGRGGDRTRGEVQEMDCTSAMEAVSRNRVGIEYQRALAHVKACSSCTKKLLPTIFQIVNKVEEMTKMCGNSPTKKTNEAKPAHELERKRPRPRSLSVRGNRLTR